jgi:hypothetical protein
VRYSVEELVDIARALTEDDLEKHFGEHVRRALDELVRVRGDPPNYRIESVFSRSRLRQCARFAGCQGRCGNPPGSGAGFDSAWEVVEEMQVNQEMTRDLLGLDARQFDRRKCPPA